MSAEVRFRPPGDPGIRSALERDGVAYISDLLDPATVARCRARLQSYEREIMPETGRSHYDYGPDGTLFQYRDVERYDRWFSQIIHTPLIMDLVTAAVNWEPVVYYLEVFPKAPGAAGAEPHQELYTVVVEPPQFLHLWIPLEDVGIANGGINFYHGSHKLGLAPHITLPGEAPKVDPRILMRLSGMRVEVNCPAGSAALFDGYMIHWSGPNNSDRDRPAMVIGFRGKDTAVPTEQEIVASLVARLFREEIGLPGCGPDEDFYAVGGRDEQAERILARMRQDYSVDISLDEFARACHTPNSLAACVVHATQVTA